MALSKRNRDRLAFFGYRSLARFAEVLPDSGVRPASRLGGRLAFRVAKGKRSIVQRNLTRVLGRHADDFLVRASFVSYCRYWLDSLRLPVVPADRLSDRITVSGFEHVRDAEAAGKGLIFALPHLGNWDFAGAWLVQNGVKLTVVVERIEPPELFEWFENFRTSVGFNVIVNGPDVGKQLIAALKRNEAIGLLCDRDVDGTGGDFEFFGEKTKLPKGPATLALRTGATLLTAAGLESGSGYVGVINPPIPVERQDTLKKDVDRVTKVIVDELEQLIRRAPEQWHCFQPNWPADRA